MTARSLLVSEPLCYICTKYGRMPVETIKAVMTSFYDSSEITMAKDLIYKCMNDLKMEGASRCVNRRKSDDKSRLDVDDIMVAVSFVDDQGKLEMLPVFVAANLERVPPLKSDVLDLCMAVNRIEALESKVEQLVTAASVSAPPPPPPAAIPSTSTASTAVTDEKYEQFGLSYADLAGCLGNDDFTVVERKKKVEKKAITKPLILTGNGSKLSNADQVKAVPRRLFAYVGRLHIDTTEDALQTLLTSAGVIEPKCKKLIAKDGRVFTTAAFMVSCSSNSRSVFYDVSIWPAGAELRDWYFRERN